MRRVREHVDRGRAHEAVAVHLGEALGVAGERGRVARDVDDARRASSPRRFSALPARPARGGSTTTTSGSPARSRRSRSTSPTLPAKNAALPIEFSSAFSIAHATDSSEISIAPDGHRVARQREADGANAAVEVVDRLAARERSLLARELVQPLGHVRVRLQERVRTHAEAQVAELLLDRLGAPQQLGRQVRDLGRRVVDRPVDRPHLRELRQHLDQPLAVEALALVRDEHDERLARVHALADDEVPEVAGVRGLVVRLEPLLARPVADRVADPVAEVGREPAALDRQHLVPAAGAMQPELGVPSGAGRERVLHLVAVVERPTRPRRSARPPAPRCPPGAAATASPTPPWPPPAHRRRDPGSGSRRTPGSAGTAPRPAAARRREPRSPRPRRGGAAPSSRARAPCRPAARAARRRRIRRAGDAAPAVPRSP